MAIRVQPTVPKPAQTNLRNPAHHGLAARECEPQSARADAVTPVIDLDTYRAVTGTTVPLRDNFRLQRLANSGEIRNRSAKSAGTGVAKLSVPTVRSAASGEGSARRAYVMMVQDEVRFPPECDGSADPEDQALKILVARAISRGDQMMAHDLASLPAKSGDHQQLLMEADCPVLQRVAIVCDPIETLAWRRAMVHAGVRGDRRRTRILLDLAARRCSA